jgi:hypothetical protein
MTSLAGPVGDFPLNDDWAYGSAAQRLAETGQLHIPGPSIANGISQVVWGALFCLPFQCSFTVLRISTLTLGLIGVLALYALIREIGSDGRTALVGAATLAVNPLWFALANTFMTDVPFVALSIVAACFLARGFRRPSGLSLAAGILITLVALLDRQLAIVLLAGIAVAYPIRFGATPANIVKGFAPFVVGLALHFAYQRWMLATERAPGLWSYSVASLLPASMPFVTASVKLTASVALYLGLFVLPVMIALPGPAVAGLSKALRILCWAVAILLFGALWHTGRIPALGNILLTSSFGPLTLQEDFSPDAGEPPADLVVTSIWLAATALGTYGAWLVMCRCALYARDWWIERKVRCPSKEWQPPFVVTALASYWFLICVVAFNNGFFVDRYLIFMIPFTTALMCAIAKPSHPTGSIPPFVPLLLLAGLSVAGTHDYLAQNRARWAATDFLTQQQGIPPGKIDGGYEFDQLVFYQTHRNEQENVDALHRKEIWQRWFAGADYVIAHAPLAPYQRVFEFPYTRWLPPSRSTVLVLRKTETGGGR